MKRIYIDGLGLVDGHFSGIGQYILGILRGLDSLIDNATYTQKARPDIVVIIPRDMVKKFENFQFKHIRYKTFPLPFRYMAALWHRGWLPPLDLWCGRGVYIFPRFVGSKLLFSRSANVVYDLSYELHKEFADDGNARFLSRGVKRTIAHAKKTITISKNSQKEIIDFYKLKEKDVLVATPALDPKVFYRRSQQEVERVKKKYNVRGDYILALSNLEPRKNFETLVEVYAKLPKEKRKDMPLFLVGVSGWKTDLLFDKIVGYVKDGVEIVRPSQYVTDEDKPAIVSGAKMLVYPSHYEGFGIPPLEAFACGVPVVAADNSSLPEVVKGLGTMVKSTDKVALTKAILDIVDNPKLHSERVREAGPKRAAEFSWEKSAQIFLNVAKELDS